MTHEPATTSREIGPVRPGAAVPITEEWLRSVGFKWHQLERQPSKHWLLWLGNAVEGGMFTSFEDIGIEIAAGVRDGTWFCWFRGDSAGRYHRFIHLRHLRWTHEVVLICEAVSGQSWNPDNHISGSMMNPTQAARIRAESRRFDHELRRGNPKWSDVEEDDDRGRALPEHLEAHEKQMGRSK